MTWLNDKTVIKLQNTIRIKHKKAEKGTVEYTTHVDNARRIRTNVRNQDFCQKNAALKKNSLEDLQAECRK